MQRLWAILLAIAVPCAALAQTTTGSYGGLMPASGTAVGAKRTTDGRMVPLSVDGTGALVTTSGGGGGAVTQGTSPWVVSGTVAATQSGAWTNACTQSGSWTIAAVTSITNPVAVTGPLTDAQLRAAAVPVSGTVTANLGTIAGVATETTLSALNTKTPALGQAAMAASSPVVIASNQSAVPVSGTVTITPSGTQTVAGAKTSNGGVPGATNLGVLPVVATAAAPTYTEGNQAALSTDLAGAVRITGSISASNPSVGSNGAAFPTSSTQVGFQSGANLVAVSAGNPLPITGSISASNPSVSATGAAAPASATYAGVLSGGNLVGLTQPLTDAQLGARVNTLGQKTAANSTPVVIASDQGAFTIFNGTADAGNSSTAALGAGGTFTGAALNVFNQSTTQVYVFSNVSSAANGISLQYSSDGTNWDEVYTQTFTAGAGALVLTVPVRGQFFRVVYTNGGTIQASFRLYTIHKLMPLNGDVVEIADTVRTTNHAQVTRAMLTALTETPGVYGEVVTHGTNADAEPTRTVGALEVDSHPRGWNGTTFDRLRSGSTTTDALSPTGLGNLSTQGFNYGYNGTTWDRLRSTTANGLAVDVTRVQGTVTTSGTVTANLGTIAGVATETTLAAMSAKLPAALGPAAATAALTTGPSTVATAIDTGTCTNVTVSATILASNAARKVAIIKNNGTAAVHVKLGATATTANPPLAVGQSLTIEGEAVYTGVIDVIASTGTQSVCAYSW